MASFKRVTKPSYTDRSTLNRFKRLWKSLLLSESVSPTSDFYVLRGVLIIGGSELIYARACQNVAHVTHF